MPYLKGSRLQRRTLPNATMPLSVNLTEGPILVGILIATFLYGVATLQTYNYYRQYVQDPIWLKLLVAFVWLLETTLTVLTCTYLYTLVVTNFDKPNAYDMLPWTVAIVFFTGGLLGAVVQSFFAWRVYVISGHLLPSIVSWSGGLARIGITAAMCGFVIRTGSRELYEARYGWTIDLVLGIALFVDVFNTGCLCYYLSRRQSKERKIQIIDKIMIWTIETGLVTSVCQIITMTINLAQRQDTIWFGNIMLYPRLYSNSMMMSLNARAALLAANQFSISSSGNISFERPTRINVAVTRSTEVALEMTDLSDTTTSRLDHGLDKVRFDQAVTVS